MRRIALIAIAAPLALIGIVAAQSNIDPATSGDPDDGIKWAWGENVGWTNWLYDEPGAKGVEVALKSLSGNIWAENLGWINVGNGPASGCQYANVDGTDFGVNMTSDGDLSGFAWSENAGWINFDTSSLGTDLARLDRAAYRFRGYAWAENAGWVNMDDATSPKFPAIQACICGDLDRNGIVNLFDFSTFSRCFGQCKPGTCTADELFCSDLDQDGLINNTDFATFSLLIGTNPTNSPPNCP